MVGLVVHGCLCGGVMLCGNLIVIVLAAISGASTGCILSGISGALLGAAAIGLVLGLPGVGKAISMLSVAFLYLVLAVFVALIAPISAATSTPGVADFASGLHVYWFVGSVFWILFAAGIVVSREYPVFAATRVLTIVGAGLLLAHGLLGVTGAIVAMAQAPQTETVVLALMVALMSLWIMGIVAMGLINGARKAPSSNTRRFVVIAVHATLGSIVLLLVVLALVLAIKHRSAGAALLPLSLLINLSPVYLGAVALAEVTRQAFLTMGAEAASPR